MEKPHASWSPINKVILRDVGPKVGHDGHGTHSWHLEVAATMNADVGTCCKFRKFSKGR